MANRVLVTGGTGFLGQHMVSTLVECGLHVRVLVRPGKNKPSSRPVRFLEKLGVELLWGEITDARAVNEAVRGVSQVFHLAGRLYMLGFTPAEYERLHVDGTRTLLEACTRVKSIRSIIHCSSTGVLGPTGVFPLAEDAPPNPSNIYEQTKAAGELIALSYAAQHALPVTVTRPALAYGPGDLHLLSWFRSIQNGLYRVVGSGENMLHPIYIEDVIDGMLRCANHPYAAGQIYHLVGQQHVTLRDMASAIARALQRRIHQPSLPVPVALGIASFLEAVPAIPPTSLPLTRSRVRFMTENRIYSGRRAAEEIGFVSKVDLATGLEKTVAWYRSEGLL